MFRISMCCLMACGWPHDMSAPGRHSFLVTICRDAACVTEVNIVLCVLIQLACVHKYHLLINTLSVKHAMFWALEPLEVTDCCALVKPCGFLNGYWNHRGSTVANPRPLQTDLSFPACIVRVISFWNFLA